MSQLNDNQLEKVIEAAKNSLEKKDTGIEGIIPSKSGVTCPHCYQSAKRYGKQSGLQRYKCKSCEKTFNALTKPASPGFALKINGRRPVKFSYKDILSKKLPMCWMFVLIQLSVGVIVSW